jgi:hypothetical protein
MTYFITAHVDARTLVIVSESRTTDAAIADIIAAAYAAQGHHVTRRQEG